MRDLDTRRAILAYRPSPDRDANFGVYADVIEPGTVAVGDATHVLERSVRK
jgi:MOSC domain-containing protein YiiM